MPNFSFLAGLEVPEKFMVVGWVPSEYYVLPNEVAFRVALVELSCVVVELGF